MLTPTSLLLVVCSHRDMLANPGIDKKGGVQYMCISRGVWGHAAERFLRFLCQERVSGAI